MTKSTKPTVEIAGLGLLLGTLMFAVTQNGVWLAIGVAVGVPAQIVTGTVRRRKR